MPDTPRFHPTFLWGLLFLSACMVGGWLLGGRPLTTGSKVTTVAAAAGGQDASATVSDWTTFAAATAESRRTGKPVLLDFSADWCGPCQRLKHEVFDDTRLGREVRESVIPVSIVDRQREDGENPSDVEDLYEKHGVHAFPTLVVLNPATGRTKRTEGYGDRARTMDWIADAARAVR